MAGKQLQIDDGFCRERRRLAGAPGASIVNCQEGGAQGAKHLRLRRDQKIAFQHIADQLSKAPVPCAAAGKYDRGIRADPRQHCTGAGGDGAMHREGNVLKGQRIVYGHSFSILGAKSFRIATGKELVNSYSPASLPGTKAVITPKKRSSM